MKVIISKKFIEKIAQNPGGGYTDHYQDWIGSIPGDSAIGRGTGPLSHLDTFPRERVTPWNLYFEGPMAEEWGSNKGTKPKGTELRRKKNINKKKKNKKKKDKDLGLITEYERVTRTDPQFIGRVQKHFRNKNNSPDKKPGAWPWMKEYWPKLPSWEPETWNERSKRDMFL